MEFSYPAAAISEPLCSYCEGSHQPADPLYRASVGFLNTPSEVIDALPFEIRWTERNNGARGRCLSIVIQCRRLLSPSWCCGANINRVGVSGDNEANAA